MSGLPASGKSSWIVTHRHGLSMVSFDAQREAMGVDPEQEQGAVVQVVRENARELLRKRIPFVWDATHLSRATRGKALDLLNAYGARIDIVYIEAPEAELRARNRGRGNAHVPDAVIDRMLQRWEPPLPSEGHSVSYIVSGREVRWQDVATLVEPSVEPTHPRP
jgi:predicted kinase